MTDQMIMEIVNSRVENPIYVTRFGSELYGLNTSSSDTDAACVYVPNSSDLILDGLCSFNRHCYTIQSKTDSTLKNTSSDIDIKVISIQFFLKKLSMLEVESCDILFSYTNKGTILYDNNFQEIFSNRSKLIDISRSNAFIGYGINQVKKYGLKGTKLGILRQLLDKLAPVKDSHDCLSDFMEDILPLLPSSYKDTHWRLGTISAGSPSNKEIDALFLFGQCHPLNVSVKQFYNRLTGFYAKFGTRAEQAEANLCIDWKAASHGLRSLINYRKLLLTGQFTYPFTGQERDLLLQVKQGKLTWREYEKVFLQFQTGIELLLPVSQTYDPDDSISFLWKFYKQV